MKEGLPATNKLIWVPVGHIPEFISGEKLSLKRLYELFRGTRSHGLVSILFFAALNLFLDGKTQISKNAFSEPYKLLSLQALSKKQTSKDLKVVFLQIDNIIKNFCSKISLKLIKKTIFMKTIFVELIKSNKLLLRDN